ncbi:MAG: hypothetical protein Q8O67_12850 [Deltaproteobacteria bacterium]|nr:hypothetical protein [Deltaproteobacteria bacterium]
MAARHLLALALPLGAVLAACPRATSTPADAGPADAGADDDDDAGFDAGFDDDDDDDAGVAAPSALLLRDNRDRLLGTLVDGQDRCAVWSGFDDVQRGVFLTVTDLLGRRSFVTRAVAPRTGVDLEMALDHVVRLWAVNGKETSGCVRCCGGGEFNRLYFSADDVLVRVLRVDDVGLPAWDGSTDAAGPHEPFTRSLETIAGQPRGQLHLWTTDSEAVALERNGVVGVVDPHIVEIDIDYNVIHESNPECTYSGSSGRERYEEVWSSEEAFGGAAFDYVPSGC